MLVLCACGKEEVVAEPQVEIEETAEETEPEVIEETAEEEAEPEVIEETVEEELEPEVVEETVEEQAKESETPTENKEVVNGGSDNSVPLTAEESQAVEQAQPQPTPEPTPQAPTPAPTPAPQEELTEAEKQAIADRENARIAQITDPNHPEYGSHYFVPRGLDPSQFR